MELDEVVFSQFVNKLITIDRNLDISPLHFLKKVETVDIVLLLEWLICDQLLHEDLAESISPWRLDDVSGVSH